MNKRHLHHVWRQLQIVKPWYFFVGFLIMALLFIYSSRQNNLTAIRLRDKVIKVDKQNGDVETALRELRGYTYAHMNTNLSGGQGSIYPPIQLKDRYDRLVAAEKARVDQVNAQVAKDAVAVCAGNPTRLTCEQRYVATNTHVPQPIPDALYKFDFIAPRWSPDVAGFSLLGSIILLVLFLVRFITERWLRYSLNQHQ
jgi:hypothetical protein